MEVQQIVLQKLFPPTYNAPYEHTGLNHFSMLHIVYSSENHFFSKDKKIFINQFVVDTKIKWGKREEHHNKGKASENHFSNIGKAKSTYP